MAEGQVAGRLEVIVEASLNGFAQKLKAKVEEASRNVTAKVDVGLGDAKGLRKAIEERVAQAATGVKARIGVELDDRAVAALETKIAALGKNVTAKVKVEADADGLGTKVKAEAKAAEKSTGSIFVRMKLRSELATEVLKAKVAAQRVANAGGGINVPITPDKKGGGFSFRKMFGVAKFGAIAGLVSLVEPAVGAIGQLVAGLTSMASAAGPAIGTLSALPLTIGSFVQGMVAGKIATQGLGDAMKLLEQQRQAQSRGEKLSAADRKKLNQATKDLTKSQVEFLKNTLSLRPAWIQMRKYVAAPLFDVLAAQVKPVANKVLPSLQEGLRGTSQVMAGLVDDTAKWLKSPLFSKRAQGGQLFGILGQNNRTLGAAGGALLNIAKGLAFTYRAAAPFQKRMDGVIESVGKWFLVTSRTNARNGDTGAFLDKAGDRLARLWSITKNIGSGLGGIFDAAEPSGVRLLATFDKFTGRWAKWTHSQEGHDYLRNWFDKSESGFTELSRMVNDTFKGMAKWATDPQIEGLIHQIRTELGPALSDFFKSLGGTLAPGFINLVTQIVRTVNTLEPAIEVLGLVTKAIGGFLGGVNDLADAAPGVSSKVGVLVGALLALKGAKKILSGGLSIGKFLLPTGGLFGGAGSALGKGRGIPVFVTNMGSKGLPGGGGLPGTPKSKVAKVAAGVSDLYLPVAGIVAAVTLINKLGRTTDVKGQSADPAFRHPTAANPLNRNPLIGTKAILDGGLGKLGKIAKDAFPATKNWDEAVSHLDASFARLKATDPAKTMTGIRAISKLTGLSMKQLGVILPGATTGLAKLSAGWTAAMKKSGLGVTEFSHKLKTLPAYVQTKITTPGAVKSLKDLLGLQKQFGLTPKQLLTMVQTTGIKLNKTAITDLQKHYKLTPKEIKTLVNLMHQQALARKKELDQNYADLRKKYPTIKTEAQFLAQKAKNDTRSYKDYINDQLSKIKDKRVDISLSAHAAQVLGASRRSTNQAAVGDLHRAAGGPITGPGTGTSDSIPAMLSNGEHVWTAKEVAKAGGQAAMYQMRRAIMAGKTLQAYATGGAVGVTPKVSGNRVDVSGISAIYSNLAAALGRTLDAKAKSIVAAADAAAAAGGGSNGNYEGSGSVKSFIRSVASHPYIWGGVGPGGYDCSGLVSAVINKMRGQPIHRRLFSTATERAGVAGLKPGFGGVLNVGVRPGVHTAGEYAGLKFEAASPRSGIHVGPSASSVGSFPMHLHLATGGAVSKQIAKFQRDHRVRLGGDPGFAEMPNGNIVSLDGRRRPQKTDPRYYAGGGAVRGPGTGTSDSIFARLSDGEHVWTAKEVAAAGGHGAMSRLRATVRGFANGGAVSKTILRVARSLHLSRRDAEIALMVARQESGLRNLRHGPGSSLGVFQQQAAWGSRAARLNVAKAARMFFLGGHGGQDGLTDKHRRGHMSMAQAAQAVQGSAHPGAYAKWAGLARHLTAGYSKSGSGKSGGGASSALRKALNRFLKTKAAPDYLRKAHTPAQIRKALSKYVRHNRNAPQYLRDALAGKGDGGTKGRGGKKGSGGKSKKKSKPTPKWASNLLNSVRNGVHTLHEFRTDQKSIRKRFGGKQEKNLLKRLDQMWTNSKRRTDIAKRLADAQDTLNSRLDARASMRADMKAAGADYGSIAGIASANGGFAQPGFLINTLKRRAADTTKFRSVLAALRKKGLKKAGYEQITALGIEQGLPLAEQLLKGSSSQIKQINSLQSQITGTADKTGADTAKAYYDAGVNSAKGLVKGLTSRQNALNKAATAMANAMVKALKKALHIKSPSRVTAEIGKFSVDGIAVGMESRRRVVVDKANRVAADIARGLTPDLANLSGSSQARTLSASARHSATDLSPKAYASLAPLVGELHITGRDGAEVTGLLDEAMFKLRMIRQGGVHADRTA